MLYSLTRRCLVNGSDPQEETKILNLFLEHNNNPKQHAEMKELARAAINLTSGHKIPNVLLVNAENKAKDLHSIIGHLSDFSQFFGSWININRSIRNKYWTSFR